jgi:glycine cleavage system T protein (aminomethyltransferase)
MILASSVGITLKRTALNQTHKARGARMVEFAGWEMPVEYSGITHEHLAVRKAAGLFDVSHMGEIEIRGPGALDLVQFVTSNDASRLANGQAQYSALMLSQGSSVDDCVVHRLEADKFFLCVNAANTARDFAHIKEQNRFGAIVRDASEDYAQLALQGPVAARILAPLTTAGLEKLRHYWFTRARCCGVDGLLARTGYTGEDGFEFYFHPSEALHLWNEILEAGRDDGLEPAGLGARNTLRLEAAYPLYGHELDEDTTLLEAGLGWIAKIEKGEFIGREALLKQQKEGVRKKLIGFEMTERGIARDGYPVWIEGNAAGKVTSGSPAPFLNKNIGLAYVAPELAEPGGEIKVEIRGKRVAARQVPLPFYKRPKAA